MSLDHGVLEEDLRALRWRRKSLKKALFKRGKGKKCFHEGLAALARGAKTSAVVDVGERPLVSNLRPLTCWFVDLV